MTERVLSEEMLSYWINAWKREMQKTAYMAEKIRSEEEAAEFWGECASNYTYTPCKGLVKDVLEILHEEGALNKHSEILDLGCGPGNYALPFSQHGQRVVALDGSTGMLGVVQREAMKLGLKNIETHEYLWEDLDIKTHNMEKAFHLVFASLTPAVHDYDSLAKMMAVSKKHCCLVTWAGVVPDREKGELWESIMGRKRPAGNGFDIIYPFNILYSLGRRPLLRYVPVQRSVEVPVEEAIERLYRYFWLFCRLTPETKEIIASYINERQEEGLYRKSAKEVMGVLIWRTDEEETGVRRR